MNNPIALICSSSPSSNFEENRRHQKLAPNMLYKTHRVLQEICYFILIFTESTECENISEMLLSSLLSVVGSGLFESFSAKMYTIQDVPVPARTGLLLVVARRRHGQDLKVILYHLSHCRMQGKRNIF